jgi:hypothetical protein
MSAQQWSRARRFSGLTGTYESRSGPSPTGESWLRCPTCKKVTYGCFVGTAERRQMHRPDCESMPPAPAYEDIYVATMAEIDAARRKAALPAVVEGVSQ